MVTLCIHPYIVTIMKKEDHSIIDLFVRELQYSNYSAKTVSSSSQILVTLAIKTDISLSDITRQQFKDYLLGRVQRKNISPSLINQSISAFKILQVDILKHDIGYPKY